MATDPQQLLSRLDPGCLSFLEKASHFCVQQSLREVTTEHLLLQMLDDTSNDLNRLLAQYGIDPLDWIRRLLALTEKSKGTPSGKPVFSPHLFDWLQAASDADSTDPSHAIDQQHLITALITDPRLGKRLKLPAIEQLNSEKILRFFATDAAVQESADIEPDVTLNADETILMTEEEVADSTSQAQQRAIASAPRIPGYNSFEKVGEGGMATVYRAKHEGLQREVALKVLTPAPANGVNDDFVSRFLREARIVARLNHPNITQIYDVSESDQLTYLAMEFISGGELAERMDQPFSPQEAANILGQVLMALQYAHDQGFVHRDIKPSNILIRDNGSAALTDFGIARAVSEDSGLTVAGSVLGTPRYMSPEQAKGEKADHRADLYSVGVLFFQMLEGRLPYIGDSALGTAMKHIIDPIPEFSEKWQAYQPFIDIAMAKNADDRFQSANEMNEAMQEMLQGLSGSD